jgi:HipA-like kinase
MSQIRTLTATRYLTPLREGSSLPALVEANDGELYVMKFAGAGQGPKALIAELVAGEIGRALGLRVPEIVFLGLDPALGPSEPNQEIRDLLRASIGLNLGMRYLPRAFTFDPFLPPPLDPGLASAIVWFDAYVTNPDRTLRNVNILEAGRELWLIDHGVALYFHHNWQDYGERSRSPFPLIKDHALLPHASLLQTADAQAKAQLAPERLAEIVSAIPDAWLDPAAPFATPCEQRHAYRDFLVDRLVASSIFVAEANRVRDQRV